MSTNCVLIVDDEAGIRFGIRDFLETRQFAVVEADGCASALDVLRQARPDAVLVDYQLADGTALDLLPKLREADPAVPVIVLTAHGSIDLAVRVIKEGADQFLTKPVQMQALVVMLERAIEQRRSRQQQLARRSRQERDVIDPFRGGGAIIRELAAQARRVLASDSPILILGETGTGKGVLARWLHANGPRSEEAFVDLNCGGLSRELLESELFGHEKGAFTGAVAAKPGLLDVAHRGSVFLDEIGDMELPVQPKLLKVLEEKQFRRVGDVRDRRVDVRLIAATHQDVAGLVREGRFRRDLYFRINTLPLHVPALRERGDDILTLAREVVERLAPDMGRGTVSLAPDAEQVLRAHTWPGNIRELRNVLERALLLSDGPVLAAPDLRLEWRDPPRDAVPVGVSLEAVERHHIERILRQEGGRVEAAAQLLGIPRSSLYQKIKRYGIVVSKR